MASIPALPTLIPLYQIEAAAAAAAATPTPTPTAATPTKPKRGRKRKKPEPKTHHNRISNETHDVIYQMRESGLKLCDIACFLQLPLSTVSSSITRSRLRGFTRKLSSAHPSKQALTPAEKEFIFKYQSNNTTATFDEIRKKMKEELGSDRSIMSIRRQLIQDNFATKSVTIDIVDKHSDRTASADQQQPPAPPDAASAVVAGGGGGVDETFQLPLSRRNTIFIDESDWEESIRRNRGRNLVNHQTSTVIVKKRSLLTAVNGEIGAVHYKIHAHDDGNGSYGNGAKKKRDAKISSMTSELFSDFIFELIREMKSLRFYDEEEDVYFLVDHSSSLTIESIESIHRAVNRVHVKYHLHTLPSYSPRLDIIQQVYQEWKYNRPVMSESATSTSTTPATAKAAAATTTKKMNAEDIIKEIHANAAQSLMIKHARIYYERMVDKVFPITQLPYYHHIQHHLQQQQQQLQQQQ